MSDKKKQDGAKNKEKRKAVETALTPLIGLKYAAMSKIQQETFITTLGQIVDIMDETGAVKLLS